MICDHALNQWLKYNFPGPTDYADLIYLFLKEMFLLSSESSSTK